MKAAQRNRRAAAARRADGAPADARAAREIVARIDEEAELFKARLQSPEAHAAFEAFLNRKR